MTGGKRARNDREELHNNLMKREITLTVDNLRLPGEVYFPETTKRPYPALCLCHGIPSGQPSSSDDRGYPGLAERFCAAGFITLIFNFRGAGPAQGNLDMMGWTRDLEAAIDYLASLEEVDKSRLCLLGSSGGAAVSVYVAANDPRVSSLATFACPAEFSFLTDKQRARATVDHFRSIGVIRDADFPPSVDEWLEGFSVVSPLRWIDRISPHPLLLIHGDKDDLVPVEHAYKLYERAGEPKELAIIPDVGHRLRLEEKAITAALDWLKTKLNM
ncbi:MAG: prolyl oligopeptidase family serine peptidase [Chloroflexi bacterium]|nr:prolyl oligopeptidase family serine peptidase [Chloroflexota bacterium]MBL7061674.1 prolyl oligopeptidase family serine peptidase [Dehalococcoidia bacterium]